MIKNIKKSLFSIFCLLLPAFPLIANISFGKTDINENDELLFTVSQNVCGSDNYSSLFYAKIKNGEVPVLPELITFTRSVWSCWMAEEFCKSETALEVPAMTAGKKNLPG